MKSGQTATIVGVDAVGQKYNVMGSDNKFRIVKPDEIEKIDTGKYTDYQATGPNPDKPEELLIKPKPLTKTKSTN